MYGCEAGGAVTAWTELGYGEVFNWAFAVSTSAPVFAYYLAGQAPEHVDTSWTRIGATIYAEECCTPNFVSWRRYPPVSTRYLDRVFQGETGKRLMAEAVLQRRTQLHIGVTNVHTGKQSFVRPQTPEALFRAIWASISMPGFSDSVVEINGRQYFDGATIDEVPIKKLVNRLQPTHVVLLANRTRAELGRSTLVSTALNSVLMRGRIRPVVRVLARQRKARFRASEMWLRECGVPYVTAWSGDRESGSTVSRFTNDPETIRATTAGADALWRGLLACNASAISSLPVPLSPRMRTGASVLATRATVLSIASIRG